jgi:hypothetical protein
MHQSNSHFTCYLPVCYCNVLGSEEISLAKGTIEQKKKAREGTILHATFINLNACLTVKKKAMKLKYKLLILR